MNDKNGILASLLQSMRCGLIVNQVGFAAAHRKIGAFLPHIIDYLKDE